MVKKIDEKYCWRHYCFDDETDAEEFKQWALTHTLQADLFAVFGTIAILIILWAVIALGVIK